MACEDVIYEFTRGDDLEIAMRLTDPNDSDNPVDLTGWTIRSQVRYSGELVDELNVVIVSAGNGQFNLEMPAASTQSWLTRKLKCDIEFINDLGKKVTSQMFYIDVTEDQTHD